ncbi:MAG TPA: RluA family pseudouridine synthase [Sphingobacterium sp.]|nr:RluA family pseudouridine synthase [Sphingobacterium sp.]
MTDREDILETEDAELYEHLRIEVDKGQSFLRIDKFLMNRIENTSRNRIQNAIVSGSVRVNGKEIKASYKVKPYDVITVVMPEPPRDTEVYPEKLPLDIVYEDDELLVVNKEAGMVVHPGYNNYTGTLVNALTYYFNQLPVLPGNTGRPGLVHRLDKNTSGLAVIAKTEWAMTFLAKQFAERSVTRKYYALVWGDITNDGSVSGYIGRNKRDRKIMQLYDDPKEGKWSLTHYKVIERLGYITLIECKLETGRTHQIRVHLKHLGHPLFNDESYGGDSIKKGIVTSKYKKFVENCFELLTGQALHAKTLGFVHPISKEELLIDSDLPESFRFILEKWRNYFQYSPQ